MTTAHQLPYTLYGVAVLHKHTKIEGRRAMASRLFSVSGKEPLTREEAEARGRKIAEETWPEDIHGPQSDYRFELACASWCVLS